MAVINRKMRRGLGVTLVVGAVAGVGVLATSSATPGNHEAVAQHFVDAAATRAPVSAPGSAPALASTVASGASTAAPATPSHAVTVTRVVDGRPSFATIADPSAAQLVALRNQPGVTVSTAVAISGDEVADGGAADPYRSLQWGMDELRIDQLPASVGTGSNEIVAVIDTGVLATHQDFAAGTVLCAQGADFASDAATYDHARNGCVDPNGHGTHVSGEIAAARNNGLGIEGITTAKILPVRVLSASGGGLSTSIAQGIVYAVDHGANVINMSLGGGYDPAEVTAVNYALSHHVVVVAAAGNDRMTGDANSYPAVIPGVISVAAVDTSLRSASFSYVGPTVDISAPGVNILSLYRGTYEYLSGTSQAAPAVAATAALYLGIHPGATPAAVLSALESSATDLEAPGKDDYTGYGMVNPYALLTGQPAPAIPTPAAPAQLGGTATPNQVALSWSPVSAAGASFFGYKLYRNGTLLSTLSGSSYLDNAVVAGQTNTYSVTAYGLGGESAATSQTVSVPLPVAPSAPASLTYKANPAQVALTWSRVATSSSAPLTGYRVRRNGILLATTTALAFTDTKVVAGTTYSYTVAGYGVAGESTAPALVAVAVPTPVAPSRPASVSATLTPSQVTLTWAPVATSVAAPVTGYNVYRDGSLLRSVKTATFADSTVAAGDSHTYAITAVGGGGESTTITKAIVVPYPLAPVRPASLSSVVSATQVRLIWATVVSSVSAPRTGYKVYRNGVLVATVTTTTYTDTAVAAGTRYTYTVTAFGSAGESPLTTQVITTPAHH